jgi:hypothetical protein
MTTNSQVRHLWAAQTRARARSSNGNCSFDGPDLYSYSTVIARIVDTDTGEKAVLITSHKHSITTTGKHIPRYSDASRYSDVSQYDLVFTVPDLYPSAVGHARNVEYMLGQYRDRVETMMRRRNLPEYVNPADTLGGTRATIKSYCRAFGLTAPDLDVNDDAQKIIDHHAAKNARNQDPKVLAERAKAAAYRAKKLADREATERAAASQHMEAWLAGEMAYPPRQWDTTPTGGVYLRVRNGVVETSMGASVPLALGMALFAMAARQRAEGLDHRFTNRFRIGDFILTEIKADGTCIVGCHRLEWDKMVACAERAGIAIPRHEAVA